ncbi:MAG: hypothetical protein IT269_05875 [Saprospiraceae bacterium]|nr:hypothetical protein [Saprospiraceae bacterium]
MKNISFLFLLSSLLIVLSCSKNPEPNQTKAYQYKGCGDFVVMRHNGDDTMIKVEIDHEKTAFTTTDQAFSNIVAEDFAQIVMVESCNIDAVWDNACNDVLTQEGCPKTNWKLVSGGLIFKVSQVQNDYDCSSTYYATVTLVSPVFQKEGSNEIKSFDSVAFDNILVGWCAG